MHRVAPSSDTLCWTYCDICRNLHETAEDRSANNHVFNHHLSTLLRELSESPAGGKLEFYVNTHSPTDLHHLFPDELWQLGYNDEDDLSVRYRYSHVRLIEPLTVVVPHVTEFHAPQDVRQLDLGSVVALTAAFPDLERVR